MLDRKRFYTALLLSCVLLAFLTWANKYRLAPTGQVSMLPFASSTVPQGTPVCIDTLLAVAWNALIFYLTHLHRKQDVLLCQSCHVLGNCTFQVCLLKYGCVRCALEESVTEDSPLPDSGIQVRPCNRAYALPHAPAGPKCIFGATSCNRGPSQRSALAQARYDCVPAGASMPEALRLGNVSGGRLRACFPATGKWLAMTTSCQTALLGGVSHSGRLELSHAVRMKIQDKCCPRSSGQLNPAEASPQEWRLFTV